MSAVTADKEAEARDVVKNNILWATGIGTIPVPVIEFGGVLVIQMKMLKELSDVYGVEYSENTGKAIVTSLLSGLGARGLAYGVVGSTIKLLPGIGSLIGGFTMSIFAGAVTYAVGKIFTQHFQSGGTFLTFNVAEAKQDFAGHFEDGKDVSKQASTADEIGDDDL